jgi:predicted transglutaminase-like cysteine proteinase
MRQATKLVLAVILSAVSTVSLLSVVGAFLIVVSHSLHYTGPNWSQSREFQALAQPLRLATAAPPSPGPSLIMHELDAEIQRVAFNVVPGPPTELSGVLRRSKAITEVPSSNTAVTSPPIMPLSVPIMPLSVRRPAEADIDRITFDTPKLAPLGFVRFCMRYPQDCVAPPESRFQLESLTAVRKVELEIVNREVNRSIKPSQKISASADEWLVSPPEGKCTDYATTKRHELLALGWDRDSLLLAEVVIPSGEHHLVLVVRTREKDLVLDNLNENIRPISETPYFWVRAQRPNNPRFWASINVSRSTRLAMNAR